MAATVLDGSREVLLDAVGMLADEGMDDYVIIGGWCPYLRNSSGLKHPGTLDVDILFRDAYQHGAIGSIIEALKKKGFIPSAKHPFQMLIEKPVGGESLIYNIDLLHPLMTEDVPSMFVDHLELDVPIDDTERRLKRMCSIVQPNSAILFDHKLFSSFQLDGVVFNLVDFTGMFVTKMDSCQKPKRERDCLDLYVALKSNGIDFKKLQSIENERISNSLNRLINYLGEDAALFDKNVRMFAPVTGSLAGELREALRENI